MTNLANVSGIVGIALLSVSVFPQVWRSWRKGVAGVSFAGMLTALVVDIGWLIWDVFNRVPAAAVADGLNVAAGTMIVYLIVKQENLSPVKPVLPYRQTRWVEVGYRQPFHFVCGSDIPPYHLPK